MFSRFFPLVLSLVVTVLTASGASAACTITGIRSVSPAVFNAGKYSATLPPPPTTISVNVVLLKSGNGNGRCSGRYALMRAAPPVQMVRTPAAPVALPYTVTSQGIAAIYFAGGAPPPLDLPNVNASNGSPVVTATLSFTISPQAPIATPLTGDYLDNLMLQVFDKQQGQWVLVGQAPVQVAANVIHSCQLSNPTNVAMNFSSDVVTGIPAGAIRSTSFGVNCTGPSRVQLSGSALTQNPAGTNGAVFDAMINYRAVVSFGGASATLTTNGMAPAKVVSPASSNVAGSNLPVNVNVNLIPGKPLLSGSSYNGVLQVTVDPML